MRLFVASVAFLCQFVWMTGFVLAANFNIKEVKKYQDGTSDIEINVNGNSIKGNLKSGSVSAIQGMVQQLLGKSNNGGCSVSDGRVGECVTSVAFVGCGPALNYEAVNSAECNPEVSKNAFARCCVPKKEVVPISRETLCKGKTEGNWCGEGDISGTCQSMGDKLICVIKTEIANIKCKKDSTFSIEVVDCANKNIGDVCKIRAFISSKEMSGVCMLDKLLNNGDCFCYAKELEWVATTPTAIPTKKPMKITDGAPDYTQYFDVNGCTRTGCRARCCDKTPPSPEVINSSGCRKGFGLFPYCVCGNKLEGFFEGRYEGECKNYDFAKYRQEDKNNPNLNFNDKPIVGCDDEYCNENCKYVLGEKSGECVKRLWSSKCVCYDKYGKVSKK